jgi:thioredoxin reductase (NADPH)
VNGNAEPIGAGLAETPDSDGAFPRLDEGQLAKFRALGRVRHVEPGEILFKAGDEGTSFFVIESGVVAIVEYYGTKNRVIAIHGAHRFLGEIGLLIGQRLYLTGVVRDPGEVIEVPLEKLKPVIDEDKALSDLILGAFMARRSILIGIGAGINLIGSRFSVESRLLREFLARNRMPHHWIDLEEDEAADAFLTKVGVRPDETPVVITATGEILRSPTTAELAKAIGLSARGPAPALCDLVIVGAGPAGLSAALYAASEGLDVQNVESVAAGGQAGTSARIENYLGFPAGISGSELTERAGIQAFKFGARLSVPAAAEELSTSSDTHEITLSNGDVAAGRAMVIATGAQYRRLDVPGMERFEAGWVYYAATEEEAQLCAGDPIVVVGGGNSAGQAAMFLSRRSPGLHLLVRSGDLGKSMSRYLVDEIERNESIVVCLHTEVVEVGGDQALETVTVVDNRTGERSTLQGRALFVFVGALPHTDWLAGQIATDENGFLLTGRDLQADDVGEYNGSRPLFLETSRPGIFAVGDVHSGSIKRVASAVGEGSMAVRMVHERLATGRPRSTRPLASPR